MGKLIDLTGQRFGHLVVLKLDEENKSKNAKWICKCDCGNIVSKASQSLRNGEATCCDFRKCECGKHNYRDITGQRFGRLIALKPTERRSNNSIVWECKCDCGNVCYISVSSLVNERTRSCGCLKQESDRNPKGNVIDMVGQQWGHLTVIARAGSNKNGQALWECECDCGNPNHLIILGDNLRRGHTTSCGCERMSHGEFAVNNLLKENEIPFEMEKAMFKYSNGHIAKFDFYVNNEYLIEYDGETHYCYNLHGWHNEQQLAAQQERDAIKNQWCKDNNIPLIRIPYTHLNDLCIEDLKLETTKFLVN